MEERKQLISLVLSNLRIENDKVLYDVQKPFDLLVEANVCKRWRHLVAAFREGKVEIEIQFYRISRLYSEFNLKLPI